jgi:hypothetical protein
MKAFKVLLIVTLSLASCLEFGAAESNPAPVSTASSEQYDADSYEAQKQKAGPAGTASKEHHTEKEPNPYELCPDPQPADSMKQGGTVGVCAAAACAPCAMCCRLEDATLASIHVNYCISSIMVCHHAACGARQLTAGLMTLLLSCCIQHCATMAAPCQNSYLYFLNILQDPAAMLSLSVTYPCPCMLCPCTLCLFAAHLGHGTFNWEELAEAYDKRQSNPAKAKAMSEDGWPSAAVKAAFNMDRCEAWAYSWII